MDTGRYEIDVDIGLKLVTLKLVGFWTVDTARDFAVAEQAAVRRISAKPRQHLVLVDLTEFNLQSQVVVGICQDLIARAPLNSKRIAIVGGEGLARIQIKRIMVRDNMRAFDDPEAARDWLLAADDEALRRTA